MSHFAAWCLLLAPSDAGGRGGVGAVLTQTHARDTHCLQSNSIQTEFQFLEADLILHMNRHTWEVFIPLFFNALKALPLKINFWLLPGFGSNAQGTQKNEETESILQKGKETSQLHLIDPGEQD